MLTIDPNRMSQVIQAAFERTADAHRWQTAIVRAAQIIDSNPYVHFENGVLLMLSEDSLEIYEVTATTCRCTAFKKGQPCKHRAAHRLLTRYNETSH